MISFSKRIGLVLLVITVIVPCLILTYSAHGGVKKKLRLGISLYAVDVPKLEPAYVSQLSKYLIDDDIIFIRGKPETKELIIEIKKGKVAIIRQSLADIEKDIKFMDSNGIKFDYLCYNPEAFASSHTPQEEKKDIVEAVKNARKLAEKHKVGLIVVTDSKITLPRFGSQMAKYSDIFVVQLQSYQLLPDKEFIKKTVGLINIVKQSNPHIPIIGQLSINPPSLKRSKGLGKVYVPSTVDDILHKVSVISDYIDGIGFLLFKEDDGFNRFEELIQNIR